MVFFLLSIGGMDSFYMLAEVGCFLFFVYLGGRLCAKCGLSPLLGEMFIGIILGPEALNIVPYAGNRHLEHTVNWEGHKLPNIWSEAGTIGVTLMIMESGMHINFEKVARVWKGSLMVAILGTFLPIITGLLCVGLLFEGRFYPDGLAAGIALAPTSVGIAIKLLEENEQMHSAPGQTILAAAFVDDIFSLVALVIMMKLSEGNVTPGSIGVPIISSFAFVGVGALLSNTVMPKVNVLFGKVKHVNGATLQTKDELQMGLMIVVLGLCSLIGAFIGSHLLGSFVAGMLFVNISRSVLVWRRQMKRYVKLTVRLFFAATVAFSMPLSIMFSWEAFGKGLFLGIFPCILSKVLAGLMYCEKTPNVRRKRLASLTVGSAMVGRGEFAYYVAKVSLSTAMVNTGEPVLGKDVYACVVWALILSTVIAPIMFKKALVKYVASQPMCRSLSIGGGMNEHISKKHFNIRLIGKHHTGVFREVLNVLHDNGLDVIEAVAETDGLVDADVFKVEPRGVNKDLDDDALKEIEHTIREALDDPNSVVLFEPVVHKHSMTGKSSDYVLELEVIGEHHPDVLHEIADVLTRLGLDISKAFLETRASHHREHGGHAKKDAEVELAEVEITSTEVEVFYASTQGGVPITPQLRAKVREEVMHIISGHHLRGEALVKVVHIDDCHLSHSFVSFEHTEEIAVIKSTGKHHKELLHEICDLLAELKLDVLKAELDHHGETDENVFYVERRERTKMLPDSAVNSGCHHNTLPLHIGHSMRKDVRMKIIKLYEQHGVECNVSVRPLVEDDDSNTDEEDEPEGVYSIDSSNLDSLCTDAKPKALTSSKKSPKLLRRASSSNSRHVNSNLETGWKDVKLSISNISTLPAASRDLNGRSSSAAPQ